FWFGALRSMTRTSAPRSASTIAANGAGPMPANSTIRTPFSGPIALLRSCSVLLRPMRASERARDQFLHDLIGAAENAHHTRIGVHARDRVLVHVAGTAKELQALVDHVAIGFRAPQL